MPDVWSHGIGPGLMPKATAERPLDVLTRPAGVNAARHCSPHTRLPQPTGEGMTTAARLLPARQYEQALRKLRACPAPLSLSLSAQPPVSPRNRGQPTTHGLSPAFAFTVLREANHLSVTIHIALGGIRQPSTPHDTLVASFQAVSCRAHAATNVWLTPTQSTSSAVEFWTRYMSGSAEQPKRE